MSFVTDPNPKTEKNLISALCMSIFAGLSFEIGKQNYSYWQTPLNIVFNLGINYYVIKWIEYHQEERTLEMEMHDHKKVEDIESKE